MSNTALPAGSLRRRLVIGLTLVAAVFAGAMFLTMRALTDQTVEATQDALLGVAATAISDELRVAEGRLVVDLPYSVFSMLGAVGEDQIFYRVDVGARTVTGYEDMPLPEALPETVEPSFYSATFRGLDLRVGILRRTLLIDGEAQPVSILIGQTNLAQQSIAAQMASRSAILGAGLFALAVPIILLAANSALRPIARLAQAVERRGPRDLRPVLHPAPVELTPLLASLNGFIARLRGALGQTETFIAEAAHHIRTPLSTVRTEAEIALRKTDSDEMRTRLRTIARSAEESSRSAGQLLDHAMVLYRADQGERARIDLGQLATQVTDSFRPTAELKDIRLTLSLPQAPCPIDGDPVLAESALRNLVDNAIKYTPADGTVEVTVTADNGTAVVSVTDTGRGLSGLDDGAISHRFRRGDNVGDVVGSGLGLAIVTVAARSLGGRLQLAPRPEGGTCATLSLPSA